MRIICVVSDGLFDENLVTQKIFYQDEKSIKMISVLCNYNDYLGFGTYNIGRIEKIDKEQLVKEIIETIKSRYGMPMKISRTSERTFMKPVHLLEKDNDIFMFLPDEEDWPVEIESSMELSEVEEMMKENNVNILIKDSEYNSNELEFYKVGMYNYIGCNVKTNIYDLVEQYTKSYNEAIRNTRVAINNKYFTLIRDIDSINAKNNVIIENIKDNEINL